MRTFWYRISIGTVGIFVIIALLVAIYYKTDNVSPRNVKTSMEQQYVLRKHNEKIAIYKVGEAEPSEILDIYISTLPTQDQMNLITGIEISGEAMLRDVIEDYGG